MAINPTIRDQAYQFFIEEAPELLQVIEAGLLTLRQEKNTAKVHALMRAAHSLKGGAASVELEGIKTLAHRMENIFKALYSDTIDIDTDRESQLLQAYDCLRLPLMQQIQTGYFDPEQALAVAEPIFAQIETGLGNALNQADTYIPSSSELGIDMARSIFEVDVAEGLEHLQAVVAHPGDYEVGGELRAQAEVFAGFAELLNQPGFGAIAHTAIAALDAHPERALAITQLALTDFEIARTTVLAGKAQGNDRQTIGPCAALLTLAHKSATPSKDNPPVIIKDTEETIASFKGVLSMECNDSSPVAKPLQNIQSIEPDGVEEIFADAPEVVGESPATTEVVEDTQALDSQGAIEEFFTNPPAALDESATDSEVFDDTQSFELEDTLDKIFDSLAELVDEYLPTAEVLHDTRASESQGILPESFTNILEFMHEPSSAAGAPEDAQAFESDGVLDDIFANAPELLDALPATSEVLEDTQALDSQEAIEEIFADAPELLDEQSSAAEVSEETRGVLETLEDSSTQPTTDDHTRNTGVSDNDTDTPSASSDAEFVTIEAPENLQGAVQAIAQIFETLPPVHEMPAPPSHSNLASTPAASLVPAQPISSELFSTNPGSSLSESPQKEVNPVSTDIPQGTASPPIATLSVRVDSNRLERMNNVVGELAINRNGLSLQNQQLQRAVRELLERFVQVQNVVAHLRELSDQMLVAPERHQYRTILPSVNQLEEFMSPEGTGELEKEFNTQTSKFPLPIPNPAEFDSLELDRYGVLNSRLQELIEDMVQLEEAVDDVSLFAKQSNRTLEQQRQMLTQLRDELMWARMLPLGEVLNRFPRVLRDLSTTYHKSVSLNLSGTGVLVDKGALEKLYDPLLHLLRNAFDHGIESPEMRREQGKPEQGKIEIRAYHQGSQTIIEVKDDGQGLDTERIGQRAIELGLLSAEQLASTSNSRLYELLFEPGFSTAKQVSELSGRGVGLDVVRSHMRSLKGSISVASSPGVGTTFTLRLPLTLSIAKLLVCLIGPTAVALPSDSIEEIVVPKSNQVKTTGEQRFLRWRGQVVPTYRLADLLDYTCPLPQSSPTKALVSVASPADWALPMLILRQEQQVLAIEIDRLITEQELVIKPFGCAIAPPSFTYGCTILGDGSLIPVIDGTVLLDQLLGQATAETRISTASKPIALSSSENSSINPIKPGITTRQAPTVLVVDDAAALRRTLALTLERAGCRVLQARDGREALEQLRQGSAVNLVVCDIEMPNMNGFEFLGQRRQDPQLSQIPVVMLTSRSNDKHRWLAMRLGATAYFTKPYLEQEFLAAIKHIIDQKKSESAIGPTQNQIQLQPA